MLSVFLVSIALSMDAFSLALSMGTTSISDKNKVCFSLLVGGLHFILPNLGVFLGEKLFRIIEINVDILMIVVFFYLGIILFLKRNDGAQTINFSPLKYVIIAFCVSVDSFSIGLGLQSLTDYIYLAPISFSFFSGIITYLGLLIGEYTIHLLKERAVLLGSFILWILAIVNLFEHFWSFI